MPSSKAVPALALTCLLLASCGGTPEGPGLSPVPPASDVADEAAGDLTRAALQRYEQARAIWQREDPTARPKGSCAACHGSPDPLDLAFIDTPADVTIRRAMIDGASRQEAELLARVVEDLRVKYAIPERDHTTFRPFQPGGSVLPGATPAERDLAYLRQLEPLAPTLFGPRIATLAQAKKAANELIDVLQGTNVEGRNPRRLTLRDLRVGFEYPRWSADLANGDEHGTVNDWISDIARVPVPELAGAWDEVRAEYLRDPSDERFWRMYAAAKTHTRPHGGIREASPAGHWSLAKFQSALIGQHLMRQELQGASGFERGSSAYSRLDAASYGALLREGPTDRMLPSKQLWDVGDLIRRIRDIGHNSGESNTMRHALALAGFPSFAVESVPATAQASLMAMQTRLAWFDIGFRRQPDHFRLGVTNATLFGEYYLQAQESFGLHGHAAVSSILRRVSYMLPESRVHQTPATFTLDNYYRRGTYQPAVRDAERLKVLTSMLANYHRMSLLLGLDQLANPKPGAFTGNPLTEDELNRVANVEMKWAFDTQPQHHAADQALIDAMFAARGWTRTRP